MLRKTTWKIAVAILAVMIAGIVYCVFFAEEKDSAVQYQTGEEASGEVDESFAGNNGSAGTQSESNAIQKSGTGPSGGISENSGVGLESEAGRNYGQADADVQNSDSKLIYVHICGAVKNPAVYSLPEGSRVCDGIAKAGGLTENAADDYVNQARFLTDGERVYIPKKDELSDLSTSQYAAGQPVSSSDGSQGGSGVQAGSTEKLPVNINTAGVSELTTLPGIGESRAESIIAYRESHGAFSRIEDIMQISGIKGAAYEKIKDRICTGNE